jgi:hypothetical protein
MAVSITLALVNRDLDKINLVVDGAYDSTASTTEVNVITPDGVLVNTNLVATNFTLSPTFPFTRTLTPTMLGLDSFIDGVYSVSYIINYVDTTIETTGYSEILFENNAVTAWNNLMEEHIALNSVCSDANTIRKRSESREMIQSAREFFDIGRANDAKTMIEGALELINTSD